MDESELAILARRIYTTHRTALDYIFEQRPDFLLTVKKTLDNLITQRDELVLDHSSKSYIEFAAKEWSSGAFLSGDGSWTASKRILLFEFVSDRDKVQLRLIIGPGENAIRQRLYDFAKSHSELFKPSTQSLSARWNTIWSKRFATASDLAEQDIEAVQLKLSVAWNQFIASDLPKIRSAIHAFGS